MTDNAIPNMTSEELAGWQWMAKTGWLRSALRENDYPAMLRLAIKKAQEENDKNG